MGRRSGWYAIAAVLLAALGALLPVAATSAAPVARNYTVLVRATTTDVDTRRMQAVVDAGGQVAITYRGIGRTIISAHNYSDATALKLHRGDLVTLGGKLSGTYRVTGAIRVRTGSNSAQVLALKARVMMQTCVFGSRDSRIVGLVKIAVRD